MGKAERGTQWRKEKNNSQRTVIHVASVNVELDSSPLCQWKCNAFHAVNRCKWNRSTIHRPSTLSFQPLHMYPYHFISFHIFRGPIRFIILPSYSNSSLSRSYIYSSITISFSSITRRCTNSMQPDLRRDFLSSKFRLREIFVCCK